MAKKVTILRSSLLSLAFAVAIPAAFAADIPLQSTSQPPAPKVLDLKAPDIHAVMSSEQIAAAIPDPDDIEVLEPETVAVHGETPAPYVPGGFAALYWAVTHPLDSWRIMAPVQ